MICYIFRLFFISLAYYCTCNAQDSREFFTPLCFSWKGAKKMHKNCKQSTYLPTSLLTSSLEIDAECRIDLVLVIDSSGSVQRVFHTYKQAALQFTKDLTFGPEAAHASIVQYSYLPPALKYSFKDEQNNVLVDRALQQLEFLGDSTYTAEAVNMGIDQFSNGGRSDAKKIFVLMTDGNSINPWKVVMQTAKRLQDTKANVYVLGLGDNLYYPELNLYTGSGSLITRDSLDRFKSEVMDIGNCPPKPPVQQTTPFAYPTVTPEIQTAATSTTQEPSTQSTKAQPSAQCTIPPGWCPCPTTTTNVWTPYPTQAPVVTTPEPQVFSPCAVDILFVLDSSGDNRTKFDRQIRFILDLLDLLIIRPDAHLVSAIVYDGHLKQRIQFSFMAYKDIQSLSKAVSDLPFFGGSANTGEALTLAKQALRDRRSPSVPALVFLVSDGKSQDDVAAPADQLRSEPNTVVYALSATYATDKQTLTKIAGAPDRVFAGMESENIKKVGLGKYLSCFRDDLTARQLLFL